MCQFQNCAREFRGILTQFLSIACLLKIKEKTVQRLISWISYIELVSYACDLICLSFWVDIQVICVTLSVCHICYLCDLRFVLDEKWIDKITPWESCDFYIILLSLGKKMVRTECRILDQTFPTLHFFNWAIWAVPFKVKELNFCQVDGVKNVS